MTRVALLLACLLFAVTANAQTVVTRTSRLHWTQAAASLELAQAFEYRAYVDGVTLWILQATCMGSVSPFDCTAPIQPLSVGIHAIELAAVDLAEGPRTAPFSVEVQAAPAAPGNLGIVGEAPPNPDPPPVNAGQVCTPSYTAPIGIPCPSFGMTEVTDDVTFTHWVDNSGTCSDSGGRAGTPADPRCTIPTTFPAGSIVQIRGTLYNNAGANKTWTCQGTVSEPVFVHGPSTGTKPEVFNTGRITLTGSYCIIEYLNFNKGRFIGNLVSDNHLVIRHTDVHDQLLGGCVAMIGSDLVVWDNHLHHCQGNDKHGVNFGLGSVRVWVLDNHIHHNGGDGVQFLHNGSANPPQFAYVGRNIFHSDRENCIDIKWARHVVISQNTCYAYRGAPPDVGFTFDDGTTGSGTIYTSGSDGTAIAIGSDGGPTDAWVIYNTVYDAEIGIRHEESCLTAGCSESTAPLYIVGNVVYDALSDCFAAEKVNGNGYFLYNTCDDAARDGFHWNFGAPKELHFENNIFSNVAGKSLNVPSAGLHANSTAANNLFFPSPATLTWGSKDTVALTTDDLALFPGGPNNHIGDPRYVNAPQHDYGIGQGSAAIDVATETLATLNVLFQTTYGVGVTILLDHAGHVRPQGAAFDIGAFEGAP
jgi:hypothetical protein